MLCCKKSETPKFLSSSTSLRLQTTVPVRSVFKEANRAIAKANITPINYREQNIQKLTKLIQQRVKEENALTADDSYGSTFYKSIINGLNLTHDLVSTTLGDTGARLLTEDYSDILERIQQGSAEERSRKVYEAGVQRNSDAGNALYELYQMAESGDLPFGANEFYKNLSTVINENSNLGREGKEALLTKPVFMSVYETYLQSVAKRVDPETLLNIAGELQSGQISTHPDFPITSSIGQALGSVVGIFSLLWGAGKAGQITASAVRYQSPKVISEAMIKHPGAKRLHQSLGGMYGVAGLGALGVGGQHLFAADKATSPDMVDNLVNVPLGFALGLFEALPFAGRGTVVSNILKGGKVDSMAVLKR